jgi:hypothetical protein
MTPHRKGSPRRIGVRGRRTFPKPLEVSWFATFTDPDTSEVEQIFLRMFRAAFVTGLHAMRLRKARSAWAWAGLSMER